MDGGWGLLGHVIVAARFFTRRHDFGEVFGRVITDDALIVGGGFVFDGLDDGVTGTEAGHDEQEESGAADDGTGRVERRIVRVHRVCQPTWMQQQRHFIPTWHNYNDLQTATLDSAVSCVTCTNRSRQALS